MYNNDKLRDVIYDRFDALELTSGGFCGGANVMSTQVSIFGKALFDVFGITFHNLFVWVSEKDADSLHILKLTGERVIFRDVKGMSCGKGFDIIRDDVRDVDLVDIIWAGIICSGVSPSSIHFADKDSCIDDRTGGTGETFWYLHGLCQNRGIRSRLKMVLAENGRHFDSPKRNQSCLISANRAMSELGLESLSKVFDCRNYRSAQSRERTHIAWSDANVERDREMYEFVLETLAEGPLPLRDFVDPLALAQCDWWLSRPLNKLRRPDGAALLGMAEIHNLCKLHKVAPPPPHEDPFNPAQFGLEVDTVLLCIDTESLKSREIGIMYAKLVAERVLKRVSSTVYAVMAVDRSVSRWSDMFDMIGTIDPGGKFYLIVQEPAGERCVRPLTIKELARLQGFDISEVFTPAQLAQLIQVLPHRTMCKVLGQMYHVGAELAHFVAALCSVPRLHPRED